MVQKCARDSTSKRKTIRRTAPKDMDGDSVEGTAAADNNGWKTLEGSNSFHRSRHDPWFVVCISRAYAPNHVTAPSFSDLAGHWKIIQVGTLILSESRSPFLKVKTEELAVRVSFSFIFLLGMATPACVHVHAVALHSCQERKEKKRISMKSTA